MLRRLIIAATIVAFATTLHSKEIAPMKKGILLIAFGTSDKQAQGAFKNIEKLTRERFPGIPVHWGFTSAFIRRKLAKQGHVTDSPEEALSKMKKEGFTHIAIQSLHTVAGTEFHEIVKCVNARQRSEDRFTKIAVGRPLLFCGKDLSKLVAAMAKLVPSERKPEEAVIWMGHGNHHGNGDLAYIALDQTLREKSPNSFVGTVEGSLTIDGMLGKVKAAKIKRAYLFPFMSVAGDHAKNDLAGSEEDSWKSLLEKAGVTCIPVLKGTAEYDSIASIWLDHLDQALRQLKEENSSH